MPKIKYFNLLINALITERIYVKDSYGDMERGIFIIRGENVVLLGEIVSSSKKIQLLKNSNFQIFQDREKEEQLNSKLTQVSVEEILDAQRREIESRQEKSAILRQRLKQRGIINPMNNLLLEDNE